MVTFLNRQTDRVVPAQAGIQSRIGITAFVRMTKNGTAINRSD